MVLRSSSISNFEVFYFCWDKKFHSRYILIKFSDRGLVTRGGKPNLTMMAGLGWTIYAINVFLPAISYGTKIFKQDFPGNIVHGNIWDLEDINGERGLFLWIPGFK